MRRYFHIERLGPAPELERFLGEEVRQCLGFLILWNVVQKGMNCPSRTPFMPRLYLNRVQFAF